MKRWIILMGWIIISFTAFSQTLKPTVLTINQDTNFCFTIPQSKAIAKYLIKGQFADSLELKYESEISDYKAKSLKNDMIEKRLHTIIFNQALIIKNKDESIFILTKQLNDRDRKLRRAKWQRILLGTASIVSFSAIILK